MPVKRGHPWSHTLSLDNLEYIAEEAMKVEPGEVHPARLFLICDQLTQALQPQNLLPHPQVIPLALEEAVERARLRIQAVCDERFPIFVQALRAAQYDKSALRAALNYPWVDSGTFQRIFNAFYGEELYFTNDKVFEQSPVEERQSIWQNISSEPIDMVRVLVECPMLPQHASFADLGCGGGGSLFPFALLTDWSVEGIEIEPYWCDVALRVAERLSRHDVVVRKEDILSATFGGKSVYYIYSPFRDTELLPRFVEQVAWQTFGTKCQILVPQYPPLLRELKVRAKLSSIEKFGLLHRFEVQ